jgi:hypothetical protein
LGTTGGVFGRRIGVSLGSGPGNNNIIVLFYIFQHFPCQIYTTKECAKPQYASKSHNFVIF